MANDGATHKVFGLPCSPTWFLSALLPRSEPSPDDKGEIAFGLRPTRDGHRLKLVAPDRPFRVGTRSALLARRMGSG